MLWLWILLASLAAFALLTWLVRSGTTEGLDLAVHQWVRAHRTPLLTGAAAIVTPLGSVAVLTVNTIVAMAVMLGLRGRRAALDPGIAGIVGYAAVTFLKIVVGRPRPPLQDRLDMVTDLSFPSGHAMGITALLVAVAVHTLGLPASRVRRQALATVYALIIVAVAWSRIQLGVHYLSDVAAGLCLGVACGLVGPAAKRLCEHLSRTRISERSIDPPSVPRLPRGD